jgi:hypothetical protein
MPSNHLSNLLKRQMTRKEFINWSALFVVSIFGIGGVLETLGSHAATPEASEEVEKGTLANGATTITDSTASGGEAVKFGTVAATTYQPTSPLLSWGPPTGYKNFKVVTASNSNHTINLDANTDYQIVMPVKMTQRLTFVGGRNVVMIGGEFDFTGAATGRSSSEMICITAEHVTGICHIEGIWGHGLPPKPIGNSVLQAGAMGDFLDVNGCTGPYVRVQNCRAENVRVDCYDQQWSLNGYALDPTFTGTTTAGSNVITASSTIVNLNVGAAISGTGLPARTTITAVSVTSGSAAGSGATVTISNPASVSGSSKFTNTPASPTANYTHPDGIQWFGSGAGCTLCVDKFSVITSYQGIFTQASPAPAGIDLRRVDIDGTLTYDGSTNASSYLLYNSGGRVCPVSAQDVYILAPSGSRIDSVPETRQYVISPDGESTGFTGATFVTGAWGTTLPNGASYVPAGGGSGQPGMSYVSPGYQPTA